VSTIVDRYTLITNLQFVTLQGVRTHTHALLISRTESFFERGTPKFELRGFVSNAAMPSFDAVIPTDEYRLVDAASQHMVIGGDGEMRPLSSGAIMEIEGFAPVQLVKMTYKPNLPLDVQRLPDGTDISRVWTKLEENVARYWQSPNMPVCQYLPAEHVRRTLGVRP